MVSGVWVAEGTASVMPPQGGLPPGWTSRNTAPGESLPNGQIGHTYGDTKEIVIDQDAIDDFAPNGGAIDIGEIVLEHEIGHTPNGEPSDPGFPGNGNGPCAHMSLHAQSHQDTCNRIEERILQGGNVDDLCDFSQKQADGLNERMANNPECPVATSGGDFSVCPGC